MDYVSRRSNRAAGDSFEAELCQRLFADGFWAHNMAQRAAGQPADIIAVRGNTVWLIDAKVCENDVFPLRRIEANQWSAMRLWRERASTSPMFALKLSDDSVWMVDFTSMEKLDAMAHRELRAEEIRTWGIPYQLWNEVRIHANRD